MVGSVDLSTVGDLDSDEARPATGGDGGTASKLLKDDSRAREDEEGGQTWNKRCHFQSRFIGDYVDCIRCKMDVQMEVKKMIRYRERSKYTAGRDDGAYCIASPFS